MHRVTFPKLMVTFAVSALMTSVAGCGDAPPGQNADDVTLSPDANFGPDIKVIPGGGVVDPVDPSVGDECEKDEDCDSGLCVEAADGKKYCSQGCVDGACPVGHFCAQQPDGGDPVCIKIAASSCKPCGDASMCSAGNELCAQVDAGESFCLRACEADAQWVKATPAAR